jgi:putative transcriptional regulator
MVNIESQFTIKNKINILRTEKQMTQQALADAVAVTRATINAMERGAYNPSLELAFRLAQFFEVDIQEIFFVED